MSHEGTKQIYGILKSQSAVYNLSKNRISIGRSKSSVIIINHPSVSKDHAIIEFDSDLIPSIKDLNSSNGTYVNGQKLQTFPQILKTNDKISFGKDPTEYIFESFNQENEKTVVYPQIVHDGKISLVNENAYQSPKINHFKNKNTLYMNNNYNNEFMMKQQQQNLPPQNMFINPINNENSKFNEQPQFFNADTENNENILDTNNVNTNNEVTFKKQSEDFTKKINKLTQEKDEMNKKITELENTVTSKTNEVKKVSDLFDQLTEEYSKLNSKHNALMIYASDLQKKVDILEIDLQDAKANEQNKDFVKVLSEKDSLITILQNEIQYYKDQLKNKSQFNISNYPQQSGYSSMNNNIIQENSILVKKIDELTENYIKENKKLKEKIKNIKKKYENAPITQQNNNPNAFAEFESQLNLQISNFNQIIADYNNRLSEAVSRIPIMFEGDKKEEAAKYLVEQVNQFMSENQKLLSDNTRLNLQINQLQNEINNTKVNQYLQVTNRNENIETKSKDSEEDNEEISNLKKKVDELESVISKLQNNNNANTNYNDYYSTSSNRFGISNNTNDKEMKECLINAINELREKEKTIDELKTKLKDTISKTPMNFDERQIVSSVSQTLREKDNLIQSLQNQLTSSKINSQSPLVN